MFWHVCAKMNWLKLNLLLTGQMLEQRIRVTLGFTANGEHQIQVENFSQSWKISRWKLCQLIVINKTSVKLLFFCRSNHQKKTSDGKTWSRGKKSRLPFSVNLTLNPSVFTDSTLLLRAEIIRYYIYDLYNVLVAKCYIASNPGLRLHLSVV